MKTQIPLVDLKRQYASSKPQIDAAIRRGTRWRKVAWHLKHLAREIHTVLFRGGDSGGGVNLHLLGVLRNESASGAVVAALERLAGDAPHQDPDIEKELGRLLEWTVS